MPLLSIITPTHCAEAGLEATIQSVLAQDRTLFEYIIVDGGSTDGTIEIIKSYADRVRWISEEDSGVYDGMNKGIALSKGRYLYFIGAGDTLRPGVLAQIAASLPEHDRGLVYGDFCLRHDATRYYGEVSKYFLCFVYNICHQSAFYGRGVFELFGHYDLRYPVRADYAINVQAFCDARIEKRYVDLVIADYERGGISELNEDRVFAHDFPELVRKSLGLGDGLLLVPLFNFVMRMKFNSSFRAFGRRLFQAFAAVTRVFRGA